MTTVPPVSPSTERTRALRPHELDTSTSSARLWRCISIPDNPADCWLWTGDVANGSPRFFDGKRVVRARRPAYEQITGNTLPPLANLIPSCGNPLCVSHLEPRLKWEAPPPKPKLSLQEAFDSNWITVNRGFDVPCHIWQGALNRVTGYGRFGTLAAHRVAWQLAHPDEELPTGHKVGISHLCELPDDITSRLCVRAAHLVRETASENLQRSPNHFMGNPEKRGRRRKDSTKCKAELHDWVSANLDYYNGPDKPTCKRCRIIRQKRDIQTRKELELAGVTRLQPSDVERNSTQRKDPAKCQKGLHDWVPENLLAGRQCHPCSTAALHQRMKRKKAENKKTKAEPRPFA